MFRQAVTLKQALEAAQKTVYVQISTADLEMLKADDFKLCFAKKVGDAAYNVVWQSYTTYLMLNSFSWQSVYQLFGSEQFTDGLRVRLATPLVTIGFGEQSVLGQDGTLGNPTAGGPATGFTLVNEYGSIHPGVGQMSIGLDQKIVSMPIYVSTEEVASGSTTLTPVEKVLVWFQKDVETSTMFSNPRFNSVEMDLTTANQAVCLYTKGKWSIR